MRSHKVLLENQKLQTIFKKWQVSHQYILLYNDAQKDVVYFKVSYEKMNYYIIVYVFDTIV